MGHHLTLIYLRVRQVYLCRLPPEARGRGALGVAARGPLQPAIVQDDKGPLARGVQDQHCLEGVPLCVGVEVGDGGEGRLHYRDQGTIHMMTLSRIKTYRQRHNHIL